MHTVVSPAMPIAVRGLLVSALLALPSPALAQSDTRANASELTKPVPSVALDSPAQAALRSLATPATEARSLRVAAAEKVHPDLVTRLEEIRVYGRNEPEDFVGPRKSPLMQFRASLEGEVTLSPAKKAQLVLCAIGLCGIYGPEGIPLGDSPAVRADARLYQSTLQLNGQFRGTLQ